MPRPPKPAVASGDLTPVAPEQRRGRETLYSCVCGREKWIRRDNVNKGTIKSCGCSRIVGEITPQSGDSSQTETIILEQRWPDLFDTMLPPEPVDLRPHFQGTDTNFSLFCYKAWKSWLKYIRAEQESGDLEPSLALHRSNVVGKSLHQL